MDSVQDNPHNQSMEFTISAYETLMSRAVAPMEDVETRRFLDTLCLENLERNGLLSYLDKRTGRFRLQDFVLETLRHLDSKRLRELSSADLNQLIKRLEECYRQVSNAKIMWIPDDDSFEELVDAVYDNLQHVASRLKSNVRALQGQAERLASIVDEQTFTDLAHTDQVRMALTEILRIHERHVTPTLQFLDERLDIRRSRTELHADHAPMALVKRIIQRFVEHKLTDHVTRLQRIEFHILAMGRDVGEIAKGLDTYVKYAEAERRRYNRTEALYNELRDAVQERQTGQQKDFMLKPSHPVFQRVRPLGDLKKFRQVQTTNINWPKMPGRQAFDEILRVRLAAQSARPQPTTSSVVSNPVSEEEIEERRFIERILHAMEQFDYHQTLDDAYLSVHKHLCDYVEDYSLDRLLDALPFLAGNGRLTLAYPANVNVLEYKGLRLRYRRRSYCNFSSLKTAPH